MEEKIKIVEEILKEFLKTTDIPKEEIPLLNDLAYIFIDHKINLGIDTYHFQETWKEKDSIQLVKELLTALKPQYRTIFEQVINQKKERKEPINCKNNIKDSFDLLYEFMYILQLQEKEIEINNDYLIETFAILAEFLLQDYLESLTPTNSEIYYPKMNRLIHTNIFTVHMLVELKMLEILSKEGTIIKQESIQELKDYDTSGSELALKNLETILDDIISLKKVSLPYHKKYLVGMLLACYLHRKILNQPSLIHTYCFLIENLENISLKEFLETIGLSTKKRKGYYSLTKESYKNLKKYYTEELEECVVNIKIAHTKK